jgi:hypothetical protein
MKYSNMLKNEEKNGDKEKVWSEKKIVKFNNGGKVCDRKGIMVGKSYTGV